LAAIDFHVAPSITHHLCDLPQLQEAARSMMAANTAGEQISCSIVYPKGHTALGVE
jgi:hypothetical protein